MFPGRGGVAPYPAEIIPTFTSQRAEAPLQHAHLQFTTRTNANLTFPSKAMAQAPLRPRRRSLLGRIDQHRPLRRR